MSSKSRIRHELRMRYPQIVAEHPVLEVRHSNFIHKAFSLSKLEPYNSTEQLLVSKIKRQFFEILDTYL